MNQVGRDHRARRFAPAKADLTTADGSAVRPYLPALATAAALLLLAGCASPAGRGAKKPASDAEPTFLAPRHVEVGRVLSHDVAARTLVIECSPRFPAASFLSGVKLIARDVNTLEPRARLEGAPYRSGRMLGAYLVAGTPRVGDEVVIAPDAEPSSERAPETIVPAGP